MSAGLPFSGSRTCAEWIRGAADGRPFRPRPHRRRPMPTDLAELARNHSLSWLSRHYCAGKSTVQRWCAEAGVKPDPARCDRRPIPGDFAALAPTMTMTALVRHYGTHHDTVARWAAEVGVEPPPYRRPPPSATKPEPTGYRRLSGTAKRSYIATHYHYRDVSLEGRAADHLRRWTFVFRCTEGGAADREGEFWRYGNRVMTGPELVERAKRHGFDPDEWRVVPAREQARAEA